MLKRFRHLSPAIKAVVVFIIFTILALSVPAFRAPINASGLLAAAAIFYSILLGFYIAAAMSNLSRLKTLVASETGALIAVFHIVQMSLPDRLESTREAIDTYLIKRFEYEVQNYTEPTEGDFFKIFEVLKGAEPKSTGDSSAVNYIAEAEYYISQARRELTIVGAKIVTSVSWLVLIVLSMVIIVCLFLIQGTTLASHLITAMLAASAISSLFILDDVDGNRFGEDQFAIDTYQDVFRAIGKLPYYPELYLGAGRYEPTEPEYRIGRRGQIQIVKHS